MINLSCRITGIEGLIDLPAIAGRKAVLHYTHPLAHIDSLHEISEEGIKYMRSLPINILAGMFLSTLRYLDAIESKEDSLLINTELQKAGKGALLHTTKALLDYVVPVHSFNRKAKVKLVKARFEGHFSSGHDARSWIEAVVTTILDEHLNYGDMAEYARSLVSANEKKRFMSPAAINAQLNLIEEAATVRHDSTKAMLSDALQKAEALRAAKRKKATSALKKGRYAKTDLHYNEETDSCTVRLHIANASIPRNMIHSNLCATFNRERADIHKLLPTKTSSSLLGISKSLEYMPTAKLKVLHSKLEASEHADIMKHLVRIVELLVEVDLETASTTTVLDDLDNTSIINNSANEISTSSSSASGLSLLERIKLRKEGKL